MASHNFADCHQLLPINYEKRNIVLTCTNDHHSSWWRKEIDLSLITFIIKPPKACLLIHIALLLCASLNEKCVSAGNLHKENPERLKVHHRRKSNYVMSMVVSNFCCSCSCYSSVAILSLSLSSVCLSLYLTAWVIASSFHLILTRPTRTPTLVVAFFLDCWSCTSACFKLNSSPRHANKFCVVQRLDTSWRTSILFSSEMKKSIISIWYGRWTILLRIFSASFY